MMPDLTINQLTDQMHAFVENKGWYVALYLLQMADVRAVELTQAILDKLAANAEREWPAP